MIKKPLLIIEHCEEELSRWLLLEYKNVVEIWESRVVFTNVKDKKAYLKLNKFAKVEKKNAKEFLGNKKCIVLDPKSKKALAPKDFINFDAVIIGGILGYKKPRDRTKKLISGRYNFKTRNLGKIQLSIDGAAFVAKAISMGIPLKEIEISYEVEIVHDKIHSTILPYGYPVIDDKPMITPGIVEYLRKY